MARRLLFVDDEPDLELLIRAKLRKAIRRKELHVEFAGNGREALAKIDDGGEFDLIFTDINMPEMDGLTLLSKLRARRVESPVVVLSAYGDMASIRQAMNRGAFDFLTKPIDFGELSKTHENALEHVERTRALLREAETKQAGADAPASANETAGADEASSDEQNRLANLGLLLAGIAHDLRSPLSFIVSLSQLARELTEELRETNDPDAIAELATDLDDSLGRIEAHGARAAELVLRVLDTAAGRTIEASALDFNAEVRAAVELFGYSLRSTDAQPPKLVTRLDPAVGELLMRSVDLGRVLVNLLQNAYASIQARSPERREAEPGRIEVSTAVVGERVELRVRDNGVGIPSADLERVFERFYTTRGGNGLGLALVRELSARNGGEVSITSVEHEFAEFAIVFARSEPGGETGMSGG